MSRNKVLKPKDTHIRIEKDDKILLKELKNEMFQKSDADVVHTLIMMYKKKKLDPSFRHSLVEQNDLLIQDRDNYKKFYQDEQIRSVRWKERFDLACEKGKLDPISIIQMIT